MQRRGLRNETIGYTSDLYSNMGMYEIGALLSLEGLVFSALGLWKKVKGQRQTGKEKTNFDAMCSLF